MKMSYNDTKKVIQMVLDEQPATAANTLFHTLNRMQLTHPQFYEGVLEHGPTMDFNSEQWFDFLSKIPNRSLREQELLGKLSASQQHALPPPTFA